MSGLDLYFDTLAERIAALRTDSAPGIREAARACADSLLAGGAVHIYDTGHLVSRELINRAGGLAAFIPLGFSLALENPHAGRQTAGDPRGPSAGVPELVAAALAQSNLRAGDVLIIGTVSGNSPMPVELCLQARKLGVKVIALTAAKEYASKLQSRHPSGKKLYEVADLVLDNHAPFGDAMLAIAGMEHNCCPFSGLGAVITLWALAAELCELMCAGGSPPTVFASINRPDGPELYEASKKRFLEKGY
jgi:uncharacterized phosphosugar-binding protein